MSRRRKITWIVLIVLAVLIRLVSMFPGAVEQYYSRGFYPVLARLQRWLFGWVPFSVGDVLYFAAAVLLLIRLARLIQLAVRRKLAKGWVWPVTRRGAFVLLCLYVVFNLAWGLNYNRLGIADQLGLDVRPYSTADLDTLAEVMLSELTRLDTPARLRRADLGHMSQLRMGAGRAYGALWRNEGRAADFFFLDSPGLPFPRLSVKPSLFEYPGLYIGFAGYYNPFTGEAQVNTLDPLFSQPYTICHEMGHQLGYAKENEANFIGFLAARSSQDPAFGYSAYMDMYLYALRELYVRDSVLAKTFKGRLPPEVRADFVRQQRFNLKYENPFEPVIWAIYGRYLRANRQPHGMVTYSEVTAWVIAYAKKYGWSSLKAWRAAARYPPGG